MKLQDLFEEKKEYNCPANATDLSGCPQEDVTYVNCNYSHLSSLEGAPEKIDGYFSCAGSARLSNLIGCSQEGVTDFSCNLCDTLISLEGAPKKINGNFYCRNCPKLSNLIGAPQEGVTHFTCSDCTNLTSLEGLPSKLNKLNFADTSIESLDYFEHNVCEIEEITISNTVKTGLLNLLRIKNLKRINTNNLNNATFEICIIINSFLKEGNITPRVILKVRKVIIDMGYKDYL